MPAFCCGVFGHKPSVGLVPLTGAFPAPRGGAARLLANGPLARRAEDLMPLLRLLAGPDGEDPLCRPAPLGDPATVRLDGLRVLITEHAWLRPISRELLAARERAAALLESLGATVEHLPLRAARRMIEPYLAILSGGGSLHDILRAEGSDVGWRATVSRGGEHTRATKVLLLGEPLSAWYRRCAPAPRWPPVSASPGSSCPRSATRSSCTRRPRRSRRGTAARSAGWTGRSRWDCSTWPDCRSPRYRSG